MARYRDVDMQPKFIPVDFAKQILPGTFEHALHVLIDDELDLSPFSAALKNDLTGAPAYHPGVLLKIVLFAYSRGIISSRRIEAACRDHVVFIALRGKPKGSRGKPKGSGLLSCWRPDLPEADRCNLSDLVSCRSFRQHSMNGSMSC